MLRAQEQTLKAKQTTLVRNDYLKIQQNTG